MKVLAISGSPRRNGNTEILLERALNSAKAAGGAQTELIRLHGKDIRPCDGCSACSTTGICHIKDEMQPIYEKLLAADGIILGTPIYSWNMSGQMKVLIDRSYAFNFPTARLANKVAGVVIVGGRTGHQLVATQFNLFLQYNRIFIADTVHGFASTKGAIVKDECAMNAAEILGERVVSLIKAGFRYPENCITPLYRAMRERYSVPSSPYEQPATKK